MVPVIFFSGKWQHQQQSERQQRNDSHRLEGYRRGPTPPVPKHADIKENLARKNPQKKRSVCIKFQVNLLKILHFLFHAELKLSSNLGSLLWDQPFGTTPLKPFWNGIFKLEKFLSIFTSRNLNHGILHHSM